MNDKLIRAKDARCQKEGCRNKGYRWIGNDPDIPPTCYCKKHTTEFEIKLQKILEAKA